MVKLYDETSLHKICFFQGAFLFLEQIKASLKKKKKFCTQKTLKNVIVDFIFNKF